MNLRLLAALAALALAAPALAGRPQIAARSYLVENAATGEVLASRAAAAEVPIASITKLMTVIVTLEHAKLSDIVTVSPQAARVGESTIELRPGEHITVGDLLKAALIQSANDAADALAAYVGRGSIPAFVAMMNVKAREFGLTETHFARPDGLDAPAHYSSAHDVTVLAQRAMRIAFVRRTVRETTDTIAGGRTLRTWNDLLFSVPHLLGIKTGHTGAAGWNEVAAVRGRGVTIYATLLGSPTRDRRNADLAGLLAFGLSRYRVVSVIAARPYAAAMLPYGRGELELVPARPLVHVVRVDRPVRERVVAATAVSLPVQRGDVLGQVEVWGGGRLLGRRPLVASRSVARPGVAGRVGFYAEGTAKHVWSWFT